MTILFDLVYLYIQKYVKKYLYTSTYGVYAPKSVLKENSVWKTFPSGSGVSVNFIVIWN